METLLEIFGGVALMIWGIRMVRTGIMRSFGAELRQVLALCSGNRLKGFGVGFAVTSVLQSSTATILIMSSFAGRGLIAGTAAFAVILGADVGTTVVVRDLERAGELTESRLVVDLVDEKFPDGVLPTPTQRL